MGDVYRATDTKLGRTVALKFLRDDLASDARRAARFQREAKALASLNHPHIAAIHGQEEAEGRAFLVMEFVAGQTLEELIDGKPLPVPEAIGLALQIIEAVESAHENGIVHRDLKPSNIKIARDGRVKVLDFGLARMAAADEEAPDFEGLRDTATVTLGASRPGAILGTPAYMSPEQARGLPADGRADVFAFGCVLFEMLTGQQAFAGDSAADVVARVLEREPDWSRLPLGVPVSIERLLRLCLEKDPRHRRQSAGDVRVDLERAEADPAPAPPLSRAAGWRPAPVVAIAAALVAVTALATWGTLRPREGEAPETRLQVVTPGTLEPMSFALSPDAADLVFVAGDDTVRRLYLRALKATEAQPIAGTEGARYPFWSPDSRSIGFFADGKLFRVDVAGGRPRMLAPAANPLGGAWGADGTILFAPTTVSPLLRVSASGGKPVAATQLGARHTNHRGPSFLPNGEFLFYAAGTSDESGVYLASLNGGEPKRLTAADSTATYLPPDHVVFVQQGKLVARRLDTARRELVGDPVTVAAPVSVSTGLGWFSTSATGVVAYRSGREARRRMTWFDRTGKVLSADDEEVGNAPSLSRDQHYLAVDRTIDGNRDVWILDLARGGVTPFTRHPSVDGHPVWSPDGSRIAFHSQRNGTFDIWVKPFTVEGSETVALGTPANEWPLDWSRDGRFLLFHRSDEHYASADLLALPMTGDDRTPVAVADTPFEERIGSFSPDGRWVAYQTDESGRPRSWSSRFSGRAAPCRFPPTAVSHHDGARTAVRSISLRPTAG